MSSTREELLRERGGDSDRDLDRDLDRDRLDLCDLSLGGDAPDGDGDRWPFEERAERGLPPLAVS